MKTSLQWLSDFVEGHLDRTTAAEALTHGGLPVENFEQHGDDTVIDVEVTSNRSDCLSHVGVARELSALLNLKLSAVGSAWADATFRAAASATASAKADPAGNTNQPDAKTKV